MREPDLSSLLDTLELGNDGDIELALKNKVAPCIAGALENNSAPQEIRSRVGGIAYLPEDLPHPCDRSGKPMLFVTQINFAELPADNIDCARKGLFILFWNSSRDHSNPKDRHAFRCVWIEDPEQKHFAVSPQSESITSEGRSLCFSNAWSLPELDSAWDDHSSLSKQSKERISKCLRQERIIQLFGYAGKDFETLQEIAAFAGNGVSWSPSRRNDSCFSHLLENAKDWKLLMQINSMPESGLDLKKLSMYLLIRQEDLDLQNYDKVWLLIS